MLSKERCGGVPHLPTLSENDDILPHVSCESAISKLQLAAAMLHPLANTQSSRIAITLSSKFYLILVCLD